jgi:hypothetical protein
VRPGCRALCSGCSHCSVSTRAHTSPHSWCPRIVQVFIDRCITIFLYITFLVNYNILHYLRNPTASDMKLTTHILRSLRARPLTALRSSSSRTLLTQSHYRGASEVREPPSSQRSLVSIADRNVYSPRYYSKQLEATSPVSHLNTVIRQRLPSSPDHCVYMLAFEMLSYLCVQRDIKAPEHQSLV